MHAAFVMALCACGLYCLVSYAWHFLLHSRSQKHQLLHLPPHLRLPQHLRLKRYVGRVVVAIVLGASGGVVMRFVCYKYVRHGVCVWYNVCVLCLDFVMNGEFLVCDAYAHNSTLFMAVCACGVCRCLCSCQCICCGWCCALVAVTIPVTF